MIFQDNYVYVPESPRSSESIIYKYDTSGRLLRRIKIEKGFWVIRDDTSESFLYVSDKEFKEAEREHFEVYDLTVNEDGDLFLLDSMLNIVCKVDENGTVKRWYLAILNEGFDADIIDKVIGRELKEGKSKKFNTSFACIHGFCYYWPGYLASRGEVLFVTLIGDKTFGIIDAIVINPANGGLSYFKQKDRSTLRDFHIGVGMKYRRDFPVVLAFYGKYMYLGRTVDVREEFDANVHSFTQKHETQKK